MATLEEIYADVLRDDAGKEALAEACGSVEGVKSFLSARGCDASVEEFVSFLADKDAQVGDVAEDDLAGAAAGATTCGFATSLANLGMCFTLSINLKPKTPNKVQLNCA